MKASIIVRTYNEEKHLTSLLRQIHKQNTRDIEWEVIVVDSGSTDTTLEIARSYGCKIEHIRKDEFSFGRSLNVGCRASTGEILIFISGHCIPTDEHWLYKLAEPVCSNTADYTYGRQIGNESSRFSECQIFEKYYPSQSKIPQTGFFCNNANSALRASVWEKYKFNEELTGLEDMHLAQRIYADNFKIVYVASAAVFHLHDESWRKVKNRFEREAIALQKIMPEVHITFFDFLRYLLTSIALDLKSAANRRMLWVKMAEIILYRSAQYWGSYQGNHSHRVLSKKIKEQYFFPK